jgi:DNA-binding FadR family transcriptional regulator
MEADGRSAPLFRQGGNAAMTERFERIQTAPAYALVAEAIEREILSGRIVPGERIGTEASLGRQFGVNRSTIREGIRLLEQSGLLRRDGSRRLCASLPRYNKLASRIGRALVLHQVTFRELWEATATLEPASAELAARNATPGDVAAMEDNLARSEAAAGDPAALVELDCEFHALIARASGNKVLQLAREPAAMLMAPAPR